MADFDQLDFKSYLEGLGFTDVTIEPFEESPGAVAEDFPKWRLRGPSSRPASRRRPDRSPAKHARPRWAATLRGRAMSDLAHVLSPFSLAGRTIRNRVLITGHSVLYGSDGAFSQRHCDYYAERARGGAASSSPSSRRRIRSGATTAPG